MKTTETAQNGVNDIITIQNLLRSQAFCMVVLENWLYIVSANIFDTSSYLNKLNLVDYIVGTYLTYNTIHVG